MPYHLLHLIAAGLAAMIPLSVTHAQNTAGEEMSYYNIPLRGDEIEYIEGELPDDPSTDVFWEHPQLVAAMRPYAVLEGEGEVYVHFVIDPAQQWSPPTLDSTRARLAIATPRGAPIAGTLYVPTPELDGMIGLRFKVPATAGAKNASQQAEDQEAFLRGKHVHYAALLNRNIPGAAWFRHQMRKARRQSQAGEHDIDRDPAWNEGWNARGWADEDQLSDTYALFTGGRALRENLQLDRVLPETRDAAATIDINTITGITVEEFDWQKMLQGAQPQLDPLAACVPADQHVIFFPSFAALVALADESELHGVPIARLIGPRAEDARTRQRYERQLGLSLEGLARALGGHVVKSVAITGSDPYFRTGTDVAVIFESTAPAALVTLLQTQLAAAVQNEPGAKPVQGEVNGVKYAGARSDDRRVCSYIATIGDAVVVTNSPVQLQQIAAAQAGSINSIAKLQEFAFFRQRYQRSASPEIESGLIFLSDATIRRWCGPRWRIGASRRTRDAAVMTELQARFMDDLAEGHAEPGPIHSDLPLADAGDLRLTSHGVWSQTWNTLEFLTPLAEVPIDTITEAEKSAYQQWRDTYQRNWQRYFDPIAIRLGIGKHGVTADLTVMPLIVGTQYLPYVEISRGAVLKPDAGDPHETLWHAALAVNTRSPVTQQWGGMFAMVAPRLTDPLGWLGQSIAIYADPDPIWKELAALDMDAREEFLRENGMSLPVAFHAEVVNTLKLTAFLTALRAYIDQTAPGLTVWEPHDRNGQAYVKVSPTVEVAAEQNLKGFAIYYAASPRSLTITPSEALLHRALDRQAARQPQAAQQDQPNDQPAAEHDQPLEADPAQAHTSQQWLGENLGLRASAAAINFFQALASDSLEDAMRLRSWSNIPILNEWRQRYPDHDPVKLHEAFWHTRLICPGGGQYVWNEDYQTMESTVFGSPAQPRQAEVSLPLFRRFQHGDFGLTFEEHGLRARTSLQRAE